MGAGGPRKPRPEGNGGDGAPPLAKGAGATHGPHTDEARTTAGILLRRHAGRRHASAGPTDPRQTTESTTQGPAERGAQVQRGSLPYLDTIETSLTKKSG